MDTTIQKKRVLLTDESNTLLKYYNDALESVGSGWDAETLFSQRLAQAFIHEFFSEECRNKRIKECISIITPFRAIHTVSSFLLGLTIRSALRFDTRRWRYLPGEKTSKGSFELFWSWICLFHDIGYKYEELSDQYCSYKNINDLIYALHIKKNLLDESENRELIKKYYEKRIRGKKACLDHGIVGALLLYDALMSLSESTEIYSSIVQYKAFYVKICDTIALHNMWRATPESVNEYSEHGLQELIPDMDQHHMIFYKDNPVLFLLGLVDTIDPIKSFCRDKRYNEPATVTDVLNKTFLLFENKTGKKRLYLTYLDPSFSKFAYRIANAEEGLMSWLGVYIQHILGDNKNESLIISINLTDSVVDKEKTDSHMTSVELQSMGRNRIKET